MIKHGHSMKCGLETWTVVLDWSLGVERWSFGMKLWSLGVESWSGIFKLISALMTLNVLVCNIVMFLFT